MSAVLTMKAPAAAMPAARSQRWLHVLSHTDPRYGGLSTAVPALAAAMADGPARRDGALAAFCRTGEWVQPAAMDAAAVSFWPAGHRSWWTDRGLRRRFRAEVERADGVHVHGLWEASTAVGCRTARELGKPYVLSAHGMLEPWALAAKRVKKQVYAALVERRNVEGAAVLHALTEAEAEQYRSFGARGAVAVVPNAVTLPTDGDGASPAMFLKRFPELRGKRLLLFLSRLHAKKGVDLLLESWAGLAAAHPDAHLVIAGPDSDGMEARLRTAAAERGVAGQVSLVGMLGGGWKWSALRAAEAYVLPSHSEGLPMALLEAMAVGTPVIATRACHLAAIGECQAGWEIEPRVEEIRQALGTLLSQPAGSHAWRGTNGARLIAERYSPAVVREGMAALYRQALTGGAR